MQLQFVDTKKQKKKINQMTLMDHHFTTIFSFLQLQNQIF